MTQIPSRFVKKVGSSWYVYFIKGRYDEADRLEMSLRTGRRWNAKQEAETYKRWQASVNDTHPIIVKHGTVHCVYIRSKPFETKKEAERYMRGGK